MSEQSLNALTAKLQLLIDIARMRRGPEDLPVDRALLVMTVVAYGVLELVFDLVLSREPGRVLAPVALDIAITLVVLRWLLQLARKPERFVQTAIALFGFQIVLAPVLLVTAWLIVRFVADSTWQLPVALLRFGVEIWVLAVTSRILRAATEWPLAACVALAIALQLLPLLTVALLFPQALGLPTAN